MPARCPGCGGTWYQAGPDVYICRRCDISMDREEAPQTRAEEPTVPTRASQSQATALVEIGSQAELFHDLLGKTFAGLEIGGHREVWPLRSDRFKNWLSFQDYRQHDGVAKNDAVSAARGVLEGQARFEGAEHTLHNRVAWHEGAIYYDLCDSRWRSVRIDGDGWRIVERPPILFRRYDHQFAQVEPARGGDIRAVLEFLNVRSCDHPLLLAWLVSAFVPDIPHPIPDFHGDKGSGKTVGQRVLRRLVDPSKIETLAFPRDKQELVQQLAHHYAPVYDNLTNLHSSLSDMLCRAITGEGFSKRQLYTDDEDMIYSYRRVILLNGINVVAQKSDLLDRVILFLLERIPREKRRPESQFWAEFEEAQPHIIGAIFDALSQAMSIQRDLIVPNLERMADFTRWGAAIAEVLGYGSAAFIDAYAANVRIQTREAVEGHIVGAAVLALMGGKTEWSGTSTELLAALEEAGVRERLFKRTMSGKVDAKGWPGGPQILSRRLNEIRSNLADLGIEISRGDERAITIQRVGSEGVKSSVGSVDSVGTKLVGSHTKDGTDATDGIIPDSGTQWEKTIE